MTIEDLKNYLLVNSNQYYIGLDDIEVNDNVLNGLIKRALNIYGSYRPIKIYEEINISENKQKFLETESGYTIFYIDKIYLTNPILTTPQEIPYYYEFNRNSKILYSLGKGTYWASIFVFPRLEDITDTDLEFLDLLTALYLKYVGSVRKGFNIDGVPFSNDGEDLVNQANDLYNETLNNLKEVNSNWFMSIE